MTGAAVNTPSRWFVNGGTRSTAAAVLFCLPYAGGGASAFRGWRSVAPGSLDLQPVQLPGRETRIGEDARIDPAEIADALVERVDRPYAIYGHSMGARLGFEVIRELRRRGAAMPLRFYVGGSRPPDLVEPIATIGRRSDEELVRGLERLGGTPAGVLDIPELRELLLPVLRADFNWIDSYRYRAEASIPVPVVAFAGHADPVVRPAMMVGWTRHTSERFRLHTVPGNHFFLQSEAPRLVRMIEADLLGDLTGQRAMPGQPAAVAAVRPACGGAPGADLAPPASDELHVWLAPLDELPDLGAATAELSASEAARVTRFHNDTDRRRYAGRCVVLRRLLHRYGVAVGTDELGTGPYGKPEVDHPFRLRFSLSHSAGLVLIGFAAGQEIGVDIERLQPLRDIDAFCDGALDPSERSELAALPEGERPAAALRIWTAKEAVLKATGDGLRVEPHRFGFARQQSDGGWRARTEPGLERLSAWRVTHLDLDGALGAVATADRDVRLRFESLTADSREIQA